MPKSKWTQLRELAPYEGQSDRIRFNFKNILDRKTP